MNPVMFEGLEHRTLLSAAVLNAEPMMLLSSPIGIVSAAVKVSNYNCQGTIGSDGLTGKFVLKLSIAGTSVTGSIYSSSWGGFSTTVKGSLTAGKLSLTGASASFVLRSLKANMSSAGVISAGTLAVTQVGMKGKGTFTAIKATSVAAPAQAIAPNMVGTYKGTSQNSKGKVNSVALTITRQSGGLIWGTSQNSAVSGFVLSNGRVYMMIKDSGGTTWPKGTYVPSTGKFTGKWSSDDGDHGTFTLTRQ